MATHRSLNKLEFKAHMSIHNMVEVPNEETHASSFTRDRFQKKHLLSEEDGRSRIARRGKNALKIAALATLLGALPGPRAMAGDAFPESVATSGRPNTNIQVESGDIDEVWNRKLYPREEKFGLPVNENTTVGFNDDGDPNLSTRF